MRKFLCVLFSVIGICIFSSCNKNEGLGGSSSIKGYVYNVVHQRDNFSFISDTIPAVGERVFIIYSGNEDDPVASRDVRTNANGMYHFEYLRKGNYVVYALSEYPEQLNKRNVAEMQHVRVGSGTATADTIYIHSGKGYGLSMISGRLMAQYYVDRLPNGAPEPAAGERVYLKRFGEDFILDDVRASDQGVFVFDRVVPPGKYEIYAVGEEIGSRRRIKLTEPQIIEITEPHTIYKLPKDIVITLNL